MGFRGDGGPPPEKGSGGGNFDDPMFSIYEDIQKPNKEGEIKTVKKRVKTWTVPKGGKDKPILMLDRNDQDRFACMIHEFKGPDGKLGSIVRCVSKAYPDKGCPFCEAIEVLAEKSTDRYPPRAKPSWVWCLTGIDRSKFIPDEGKNKGKVYTDFRRLVMVTSKQYEDMSSLEEKEPGGWRGRTFDVSRSDENFAPKIGSQWYPTNPGNPMTDEDLHAEFAERAKDYGLTPEQFCEPFDYEKLLPLYSYEEACALAAKISGKAVEVPSGDAESISF